MFAYFYYCKLNGLDMIITQIGLLHPFVCSHNNKQMFESVVKLLHKVEGRDKITKFFIYLFKLIDATLTIYRDHPTYRREKIAIHLQRARQFMRIGKFLIEYEEAVQLIKKDSKDEFGRLISIILHAIFSFYWAIDNISLAAAYGVINIPEYEFTQTGMTVKFIGMAIAAFFNLRTWLRLHYQELQIRKELKLKKTEHSLAKEKELIDIVKKQWKMFLLCVKIYGDMLPTIGKSELASKLLGIKIPRIIQALGGLLNASVSCLIAANGPN